MSCDDNLARLPQVEFVGGPLDGFRIGMDIEDMQQGWTFPNRNNPKVIHVYKQRGKEYVMEYKGVKHG